MPDPPEQLVESVRSALRRLTSEIDGLDRRAAQHFNVNRTDQHCLDVLASRGPLTPSQLGCVTGLSSGGVTIALDRLQQAGLVRRRTHPTDGRSVLAEATDTTRRLGREFFGPLATEERRLLTRYPPNELEAIRSFLQDLATAIAQRPSPAGSRTDPEAPNPRR
jgi:DNA-binding MarR family transcriptional regulator